MKKWKRALAVAAATTLAVSSTSIQSFAAVEGIAEEEVQLDSELDEDASLGTADEEVEEGSSQESVGEAEEAEAEASVEEEKDSASEDEDEKTLDEKKSESDSKDDASKDEGDKKELKDGLYRGTAKGFKSDITVEVKVSNGKIESINVVNQNDTERFWQKAVAIIDSIINNQSTEVDTVSGATYSSKGIKEAIENALASEPINEEEQKTEENASLSGQGTKEDPFIISNEKEIKIFRDSVNSGESYQGQYIKQTSDIALTEAWTPIGIGKDKPFSGMYDGNNYEISNLTVTSDTAVTDGNSYYAGLFGYATSYADFSNIKLDNVKIDVKDKSGIVYAGALVACMYNTVTDGSQVSVVDNCSAYGQVNVHTNSKSTMTGGLVGMANQYAAISNNTAAVSVSANTNDVMGFVGGIVAMASTYGYIANNAAIKDVTIISNHSNATAGGLVGQAASCLIFNNYSKGTVSGTKSGGLVGNVLTNTWLVADYYCADNGYGANLGNIDDDTVKEMAVGDMSTSDFQSLLHSNLSNDEISKIAELVDKEGKINFASYKARVENYHDWKLVGSDVVISENIWAETSNSVDDSIFEAGDGSQNNPYIIASETQLRAFAKSLSEDNTYKDKYIVLDNDIELTDGDWTPIGEGEYAFSGNFDGNGHTVSGLRIGNADNHYHDNGSLYYAFFGALDGDSYVKDLNLDVNIYVEGDENLYVAGLAGYAAGTIDSVTVDGVIWGRSGLSNETANHFGGGLVGYLYRANVLNCVNNADVFAQATGGVAEAGGIGGLNNRSLIANCVGNGKISGAADRQAEGMAALGGIMGVHAGTMVSCVANADIDSTDYSMYVGELAGWATGIAVLYNNFYNRDASQIIEGKNVNPVESVGWLVGPGTTEENEQFSGGVNSGAIGVTSSDINSEEFAKRLNDLFNEYPVNIADYTSKVSLRKWNVGQKTILPNGQATSYIYKEPIIEKEEEEVKAVSGVFFGRSKDKTTVIKLYYDEDKKLVTEVVSGDSDENSNAYKEAYASAMTKMENNDHTEYGKVDPTIFASGDGTQENPYIIASEEQLINFNKSLNEDEDYTGTYVALGSDIKLTKEWTLAGGNTPYPFSGIFDGRGYTISGLRIGSEEQPSSYRYAGLFPYLLGAIVKDVRFTDAKIYSKTNDDKRYYAGVLSAAAEAEGTNGYIDSVYVDNAYVNLSTNSGAAYVAGLIGYDMDNVIANCKVDASVVANSKAAWVYAGVLTGLTAWSGIINNRVSGTVTVSANLNKAAAGGIAGMMAAATYSNAADVTISSERYTNDLGQVSGRNTGISYGSNDYYNEEASVVCGGETVETKAVGTVVDGAVTTEFYGMSKENFHSDALLEKMNGAAEKEDYQNVLAFLKDSWELDVAGRTSIKPWKLSGTGNSGNQESTVNKPSAQSSSASEASSSEGSSSEGSSSSDNTNVTGSGTASNLTGKQISDESIPLSGNRDNRDNTDNTDKRVTNPVENNSSDSKAVNNNPKSNDSTAKAGITENETNSDTLEESSVADDKLPESEEEEVLEVTDEEVPAAADEELSNAEVASSNVILILVGCILVLAALGIMGAKYFKVRK
ncbi:FMN-binding domain-containing protein [Pseudobutyrivibrio sp. YE44]|uniref:FMN-binding protein n=1 Tax=Pseudobutyrivibrio sp. YE44 TaxID=1520802 RepID=UPI000884690B|nr:FMN-binding protein [Pseudobutyrivibrio sp. YE44]SDB22624.1 FMN-binding domain-containing protein [Pseudobutyrivibrio sp. YE44]